MVAVPTINSLHEALEMLNMFKSVRVIGIGQVTTTTTTAAAATTRNPLKCETVQIFGNNPNK